MEFSSIRPGMVVSYSEPGKTPITIMVTKTEQKKISEKITTFSVRGYSWETKKTYRIPYYEKNRNFFHRDIQTENSLPKTGALVTVPTKQEQFKGMIKSFSGGFYGIVLAGDTKKIKIPYGSFSVPENPPKPKDDPDSPTKDWSLTGYKESSTMSEETICFSATIRKNNNIVMNAGNSGNGGPNTIYPVKKGTNEDLKTFFDATKKWAQKYSGKQIVFEPDGDWVIWQALYRPFGVTEKEYFSIVNS